MSGKLLLWQLLTGKLQYCLQQPKYPWGHLSPTSAAASLSEITRVNSNVGAAFCAGNGRTSTDSRRHGRSRRPADHASRWLLYWPRLRLMEAWLCAGAYEWLLHSSSLEEFKCCISLTLLSLHTLEPLGEIEASQSEKIRESCCSQFLGTLVLLASYKGNLRWQRERLSIPRRPREAARTCRRGQQSSGEPAGPQPGDSPPLALPLLALTPEPVSPSLWETPQRRTVSPSSLPPDPH